MVDECPGGEERNGCIGLLGLYSPILVGGPTKGNRGPPIGGPLGPLRAPWAPRGPDMGENGGPLGPQGPRAPFPVLWGQTKRRTTFRKNNFGIFLHFRSRNGNFWTPGPIRMAPGRHFAPDWWSRTSKWGPMGPMGPIRPAGWPAGLV